MREVIPPCVDGMEAIYVMMAEDNVIRYVGRSNSPGARFVWHLSMAKRLQRRGRKLQSGEYGYGLTDWIAELLARQSFPKMFVVMGVESSGAELEERRWINKLVNEGIPLLNDGRNYGPPQVPKKFRSYIEYEESVLPEQVMRSY